LNRVDIIGAIRDRHKSMLGLDDKDSYRTINFYVWISLLRDRYECNCLSDKLIRTFNRR